MRIWTKRAWNYSLISLVTIWLHILIFAIWYNFCNIYIFKPIICVFCHMKNGYCPCYKHLPWVSLYAHLSVVLLHEDKHNSFKPFAVSTALKKIKHQTSLNALCPLKLWITFVVILQESHVHAYLYIIINFYREICSYM